MLDHRMSVKILSQEDLIEAGCFDMRTAIEVVEDVFSKYANGDIIFPDKISVVFKEETQDRINCLPAAILSDGVYGMKWVSVFPENPREYNRPNLTAVYILSEIESGYPIAFMEGSMCSNMRTAAVGAVAAKYLANADTSAISFIGAGEQAKMHFLAMKEMFPNIRTCKVASRTSESVDNYINQMSKYYPNVDYVNCKNNYKEAVIETDIIVTAISGQEKILQPEWIKTGAFYCHVAGLEDDFGVALKASKIVCDKWEIVKHRSQTISQMYKLGLLKDKDIYADLHEIIIGKKVGREKTDEFIYFNSVGMSFVDTSLAYWMYKRAVNAGKGYEIVMKKKSVFDL